MPLYYYLFSCILKAHKWNVVHFNPFSAQREVVQQSIKNKALNVQYNNPSNNKILESLFDVAIPT